MASLSQYNRKAQCLSFLLFPPLCPSRYSVTIDSAVCQALSFGHPCTCCICIDLKYKFIGRFCSRKYVPLNSYVYLTFYFQQQVQKTFHVRYMWFTRRCKAAVYKAMCRHCSCLLCMCGCAVWFPGCLDAIIT